MTDYCYGIITRNVIDQLFLSAEHLRSNNYTDAQTILQGMEKSVDDISLAAELYREQVNREQERCINQIERLEVQIGDLYQQGKQIVHQISDIKAQLSEVDVKEDMLESRVKELNKQLEAAKADLRNREAKLEELKTWFWVPGYGQYLAIRTLADDDIGRTNSLMNMLNDLQYQISSNEANLIHLELVENELERQSKISLDKKQQLIRIQEEFRKQENGLKETYVFLSNAELFWGKVKQVLKIDVKGALENLELVLNDLGKKITFPAFDDIEQELFSDMKEGLIKFADTIDNGTSFLLMIPQRNTEYQIETVEDNINTENKQRWELKLAEYKRIIHAPNGDFSKSHEDTIINYLTWGGTNWTTKVEGNKFIHAPNGDFSKSHEDTIINYLTWGGTNWTAKVEGNKFIHAPNGDFSKSHEDTIINYLTWGGTNWTAKFK